MEQFKTTERETKTKAYSKEGLSSEKNDDGKQNTRFSIIIINFENNI